MKNMYLKFGVLIANVILIVYPSVNTQELNFLENQVKSENNCGTPLECYLSTINLLKSFKQELQTNFDNEKAELQKKFDYEKAELQKKFDYEKSELQKKFKEESEKSSIRIGTISFYSINKIAVKDEDLPLGWVTCDGRTLLRKDFEELYKILGDLYGSGDGQSTFNIPDLRGRVIVGSGQGTGLNFYNPGDKGGEENHTLSINEMPYHQHSYSFSAVPLTGFKVNPDANGRYDILFTQWRSGDTTSFTGGNSPHNNLQPYISIHPIIRIK
jgi:microcystin-dependent protein